MNAKDRRERLDRMSNALDFVRTIWSYGQREGLTTEELVAFLRLPSHRSISRKLVSLRLALKEIGMDEASCFRRTAPGKYSPQRWCPTIDTPEVMTRLEEEVRKLTEEP